MPKIKKSNIFVFTTVLYTILILYLSVTSNLENLKNFLIIKQGHKTSDLLVENNLSFIKDFLIEMLKFITGLSIDPGHLVIYFGFGVLLYLTFSNSKNPSLVKYSAVCAVSIGTAYGILNEIFQIYLPLRVASVTDVMSNFIGLALAQIFVIIFALGLKVIFKRRDTQ